MTRHACFLNRSSRRFRVRDSFSARTQGTGTGRLSGVYAFASGGPYTVTRGAPCTTKLHQFGAHRAVSNAIGAPVTVRTLISGCMGSSNRVCQPIPGALCDAFANPALGMSGNADATFSVARPNLARSFQTRPAYPKSQTELGAQRQRGMPTWRPRRLLCRPGSSRVRTFSG